MTRLCFATSTGSLALCSGSFCAGYAPHTLTVPLLDVSSIGSKLRWGLQPCSPVSLLLADSREKDIQGWKGGPGAKLLVCDLPTHCFFAQSGKAKVSPAFSAHRVAVAEGRRERLCGLQSHSAVTLFPNNHGQEGRGGQHWKGGGRVPLPLSSITQEMLPRSKGTSTHHSPSLTPSLECSSSTYISLSEASSQPAYQAEGLSPKMSEDLEDTHPDPWPMWASLVECSRMSPSTLHWD